MLQVTWENPFTVFRPEGHDVWRHFRRTIDRYMERHPGRDLMMVAEAYMNGRPDLMAAFDDWLTIRSLPLDRAREHLRDIRNVGVPIDDVAIFQTSGTSGDPAIVVLPSSFVEYAYGILMARFERYHWKLLREVRPP